MRDCLHYTELSRRFHEQTIPLLRARVNEGHGDSGLVGAESLEARFNPQKEPIALVRAEGVRQGECMLTLCLTI